MPARPCSRRRRTAADREPEAPRANRRACPRGLSPETPEAERESDTRSPSTRGRAWHTALRAPQPSQSGPWRTATRQGSWCAKGSLRFRLPARRAHSRGQTTPPPNWSRPPCTWERPDGERQSRSIPAYSWGIVRSGDTLVCVRNAGSIIGIIDDEGIRQALDALVRSTGTVRMTGRTSRTRHARSFPDRAGRVLRQRRPA